MKYVYQVTYFGFNGLFCKYEFENEIFSSFKKAKNFLQKVVKEEERKISDKDFYFYKIKIIKKALNILEEDIESIEYIYDLTGRELFCSSAGYDYATKKLLKNYKIGTIVKILPFPWNLYSSVDIPIIGIIGGISNDEYIVYTIDIFKIIHLHINENAIELASKEYLKNEDLLKLSKYIHENFVDESKIPEYSYEL